MWQWYFKELYHRTSARYRPREDQKNRRCKDQIKRKPQTGNKDTKQRYGSGSPPWGKWLPCIASHATAFPFLLRVIEVQFRKVCTMPGQGKPPYAEQAMQGTNHLEGPRSSWQRERPRTVVLIKMPPRSGVFHWQTPRKRPVLWGQWSKAWPSSMGTLLLELHPEVGGGGFCKDWESRGPDH